MYYLTLYNQNKKLCINNIYSSLDVFEYNLSKNDFPIYPIFYLHKHIQKIEPNDNFDIYLVEIIGKYFRKDRICYKIKVIDIL